MRIKALFFAMSFFLLFSCSQDREGNTESSSPAKTEAAVEDKEQPAEEAEEAVEEEEQFEDGEFAELNERLKDDAMATPGEIMHMYYGHGEAAEFEGEMEGEEMAPASLETEEITLENGNTQITLIEDGLMDDATQSFKVIMELEKTGDIWQIVSIKQNWRCWRGENPGVWTTHPCI